MRVFRFFVLEAADILRSLSNAQRLDSSSYPSPFVLESAYSLKEVEQRVPGQLTRIQKSNELDCPDRAFGECETLASVAVIFVVLG